MRGHIPMAIEDPELLLLREGIIFQQILKGGSRPNSGRKQRQSGRAKSTFSLGLSSDRTDTGLSPRHLCGHKGGACEHSDTQFIGSRIASQNRKCLGCAFPSIRAQCIEWQARSPNRNQWP